MSVSPRMELLVFGIDDAGTQLEGQLLGALERAQSGGAIRVAEVLVVARDERSGELATTRLRGDSAGLIGALTDFRTDPRRRPEASARALGADDADAAAALAELSAALQAGTAIAAVLVEHRWATALAEAVDRSGGRALADEPVADGTNLARAALAVVRDPRGGTSRVATDGARSGMAEPLAPAHTMDEWRSSEHRP